MVRACAGGTVFRPSRRVRFEYRLAPYPAGLSISFCFNRRGCRLALDDSKPTEKRKFALAGRLLCFFIARHLSSLPGLLQRTRRRRQKRTSNIARFQSRLGARSQRAQAMDDGQPRQKDLFTLLRQGRSHVLWNRCILSTGELGDSRFINWRGPVLPRRQRELYLRKDTLSYRTAMGLSEILSAGRAGCHDRLFHPCL